MLKELWTFRDLIWELSKRDFILRYRGSYAGFLWSLLYPVSILTLYSSAFGLMFSHQSALSLTSAVPYALAIFPGLTLFQALVETLNKAPTLIASNHVYVKKMVFPLELMPFVTVCVALLHSVISLVIWVVAYGLFHGRVPGGVVYLPMILVLFAPVLLAICLLVSALGVYLRDISHFTSPLGQALLLLSPVFYSIDGFSSTLRAVFLLNPLTMLVEQTKTILEQGRVTAWVGLAVYLSLALAAAWISVRVFRRLRPDFADLL